jgi:hypothetical protein
LWRKHLADVLLARNFGGIGPSKLLYDTSRVVKLSILSKEDGMPPLN